MSTLSPRAKVYGLFSLLFAALSAVACVFLILGALGLSAWVAFDEPGVAAAIAGFGVFGGIVGLGFSAVQAYGAVGILNRRKVGMWIGLVFAAMSLLAGLSGAWFSLAWGGFGLWALWTSRQQFR